MIYRAAYLKTYFDNMILPYIIPDELNVEKGKWYLMNTKFGEDLGYSFSGIRELPREKFQLRKMSTEQLNDADIDDIVIDDASILEEKTEHVPADIDNTQIESLKVIRAATPEEVKEWNIYRDDEGKAFESAKNEIKELNLDMKLINVHFLFQKKKVIFNFTADNRVDFRQLVKKLAGLFKTRIEMRQIGVRDAAKVEGGYGVCGLINCCRRSNCHINSIYLKMGKDQGFVVNSSKLTGLCGRLMCCLAYEMNFYNDELKKYPEIGSYVTDGNKDYTISSLNVLKKEIYIMDDHHHQKKVQPESLKFIKKEPGGKSLYQLSIENAPPKDLKVL